MTGRVSYWQHSYKRLPDLMTDVCIVPVAEHLSQMGDQQYHKQSYSCLQTRPAGSPACRKSTTVTFDILPDMNYPFSLLLDYEN